MIPSAFGYAAQVVVLDPDSGEVHRVIAAHDVGRAVDSPYGMKRAGEIGPAGS